MRAFRAYTMLSAVAAIVLAAVFTALIVRGNLHDAFFETVEVNGQKVEQTNIWNIAAEFGNVATFTFVSLMAVIGGMHLCALVAERAYLALNSVGRHEP